MSFEAEKFEPLVSIIIPVYNGANYMREAIDSALAQTYKNIEVIVVNDGSKDDGETDRVALSYGEKIRYIHKENGGVSTALNEGIRNMKGEYFSWLSHDDAYHPDKIEKQIELLGQYEDRQMVVKCSTEFIDQDSQLITSKKASVPEKAKVLRWDEALTRMLSVGSYNGCTLLIHKGVFEKCGFFDERLRFNQDGFMWSKIFLKGYSMLICPFIGVKSRIHGGQLTRSGIALFHSDSEAMSEFLIPAYIDCSTKENRLIFHYAMNNAKYQNKNIVKKLLGMKVLTAEERCKVGFEMVYGNFRAVARKIYYSVFRKIKVKGG